VWEDARNGLMGIRTQHQGIGLTPEGVPLNDHGDVHKDVPIFRDFVVPHIHHVRNVVRIGKQPVAGSKRAVKAAVTHPTPTTIQYGTGAGMSTRGRKAANATPRKPPPPKKQPRATQNRKAGGKTVTPAVLAPTPPHNGPTAVPSGANMYSMPPGGFDMLAGGFNRSVSDFGRGLNSGSPYGTPIDKGKAPMQPSAPYFPPPGTPPATPMGMGSGMLPVASPQYKPSPPHGSPFGMSPGPKTGPFLHYPSSGGLLGTPKDVHPPAFNMPPMRQFVMQNGPQPYHNPSGFHTGTHMDMGARVVPPPAGSYRSPSDFRSGASMAMSPGQNNSPPSTDTIVSTIKGMSGIGYNAFGDINMHDPMNKDIDAQSVTLSSSAVSSITDDGMGQSSSSTIGQIVTAVLMRVYGPGTTVINDSTFAKIPDAVKFEINSGRYIDAVNNPQGAADLALDVCVEVRKWLINTQSGMHA
jgi:hypothetical protein